MSSPLSVMLAPHYVRRWSLTTVIFLVGGMGGVTIGYGTGTKNVLKTKRALCLGSCLAFCLLTITTALLS